MIPHQPLDRDIPAARPRPAQPKDGLAWVTGASSGIGAALVRRLHADGWQVVASSRFLGDEAIQLPSSVLRVPLDVTDRPAVGDAVARIEADRGPIALAVLNAGVYEPVAAPAFDAGSLSRMVAVNLQGCGNVLEALLPQMALRRAGQVALMASLAGYVGLPRASAYGATKAALINMGESLRLEMAPHGVLVQIICPGFVRTPATSVNEFAMPFLMDPDDAAHAIARGLGKPRFEIAFPAVFAAYFTLLRALPYGVFFPLARWLTRTR